MPGSLISGLEAGRDVVFSDYDRFGLLRYYAAQVKIGGIRSRTKTQELRTIINQLNDAYETKYRDVATGTEHKISGVYLIVNGIISDAAKQILFGRTGAWLHILDQNQLQIAESSRILLSEHDRRVRYFALKIELMNNRKALDERPPEIRRMIAREGTGASIGTRLLRTRSLERVLDVAVSELHPDDLEVLWGFYWLTDTINFILLKIPIGSVDIAAIDITLGGLADKMEDYLRHVDHVDKMIEYVLESGEQLPGKRLACSPVVSDLMKRVREEDSTPSG